MHTPKLFLSKKADKSTVMNWKRDSAKGFPSMTPGSRSVLLPTYGLAQKRIYVQGESKSPRLLDEQNTEFQ